MNCENSHHRTSEQKFGFYQAPISHKNGKCALANKGLKTLTLSACLSQTRKKMYTTTHLEFSKIHLLKNSVLENPTKFLL